MALGKGLNSLIPARGFKIPTPVSAGADADRIWHIPVGEIVPNPEQPRRVFAPADLAELVESIKLHGIMQPLTVTEKDTGGYELVAGERRLRAATLAGLPTVPAIVRTATNQEKLELALIENIQRQNLNPIEEAFSFRRLIAEFGLTQEMVALRVGKSRSAVANTVRLLDLPEIIQAALSDGRLSAGKARALLSISGEREQLAVFHEMMGEKASVRDVERAAKAHRGVDKPSRRDPNLVACERILEDRLGAKVHISKKGERGTIIIDYHTKEEFKRLIEELS